MTWLVAQSPGLAAVVVVAVVVLLGWVAGRCLHQITTARRTAAIRREMRRDPVLYVDHHRRERLQALAQMQARGAVPMTDVVTRPYRTRSEDS